MNPDSILEILGFSVGLLYLWWEYHANPKVWLASVIMPAISMWIYYSKGLYADFGINIYYLVIAVYGFVIWTRGGSGSTGKKKASLPIAHTPRWAWVVAIVGTLVLWRGIWWILVSFTDSTVPVADAFTTSLSIVGLWMLARKYAEQWLAWFVVDIVCCGLYLYKGLPFYCALYGIYTVIAIFGYRKWLRLMAAQQ
ncbi:nicotinamide riboside transporter PnuC [uncultured Duncaniella sp.]|uniref:nicotinamide riboside transporter PnuC n=1 Tax=uncultured Duncaniella sp. TaxID=2768039 RepID=UPI002674C062|nr:nicotinamide riboside transporter PnuC [uncultured Duncaniella sp.]